MRSKLLPFLLFCSFYGVAQDSSFQIKDYKYRTPGFKALQLNINLSGSFDQSGVENTDPEINRSYQLMPAAVFYLRVSSTDKRQHQSSISLHSSLSYLSGYNGSYDYKDNRTDLGLTWERGDRFYKNNLWFYEIGNTLSAGLNNRTQKYLVSDQSDKSFTIENTFSFGVGKGRVEWVQDAQMALFILNDLAEQGLLNGNITPEKANAFAQLITDINNQRVFDSRRRRIYELTRIDSFLQSSGLVTRTDIRHFTTVNDNWALAINPNRLAGSNWYFRVRPGLGYEKSKVDNKYFSSVNDWKNFYLTISPVLGYERYVPTSLKWQHNMGVSIAYTGQKYNSVLHLISSSGGEAELEDHNFYWDAAFNSFYGIGYFPNNRTQLYSTLNLDAHYKNTEEYLISPSLNFNMDYFLSYRTYLRANFSIDYDYMVSKRTPSGEQKLKNIHSGFTVGLTHMIF